MAEATRALVFNGDPRSDKRFQMIRTAVLNAGDRKGPRDRETIRKEARILDALDAISEPDVRQASAVCPNCGALLDATAATVPTGDVESRRLLGGRLDLRAEDHALLTKYLDTTPWLPSSARAARDVQDFADGADKIDA